ncbi:hypothetical protein [Streptomyces sp. NPDC102476]|uniref:hypothetical protein n=1 Tax=Streptomyces sp. NPDC102476 TaxID=3366181 RepID=UPI00380DEFF9
MTTTITLQEAEQQLAGATATVEQLKAKILDHGPGSVTAEELGAAVLAVEHASLAVQHAGQHAQAQAEAERQQQLHGHKKHLLDQAGAPEDALAAMQQIEEAVALLVSYGANRQQLVAQGAATLRHAGVPRASEGVADQHAGLAWSDASMGRGETLHIDGRQITTINAGLLIGAAITRGCRTAGRGLGHLSPVVLVDGTGGAAEDPETWLKARY